MVLTCREGITTNSKGIEIIDDSQHLPWLNQPYKSQRLVNVPTKPMR
jgi:hypothetical protein